MNGDDVAKKWAWRPGVLGFVTDFTLERIPWSFKLEDVKLGERLTFWYGSKDYDSMISASMDGVARARFAAPCGRGRQAQLQVGPGASQRHPSGAARPGKARRAARAIGCDIRHAVKQECLPLESFSWSPRCEAWVSPPRESFVVAPL